MTLKPYSVILLLFALAVILVSGCDSTFQKTSRLKNPLVLVDPLATKETKALFHNLLKHQGDAIMFGHQDALAYGIGWWADDFKSDVEEVSGKWPAVYGWDVGKIGMERNIDSVLFDDMTKWIINAYQKGGINTLSWHMDNPVTGGDSWDKTPAVQTIIPGGENHEFFKSRLDELAIFIEGLKTSGDTPVPIIFRPFHELNHNWFWWGRKYCSEDDYITLFRFTVEYLRDIKGLHNILYAYSTDRFNGEEEYLERFPGENYVDILGYDDYRSLISTETVQNAINSLRIIANLGSSMNKPFAFTETGFETIPIASWWTEHVLNPIKADSLARNASWILVWRNHSKVHHYAPYPDHPSSTNFREFADDEFTWFLEDLPNMYD